MPLPNPFRAGEADARAIFQGSEFTAFTPEGGHARPFRGFVSQYVDEFGAGNSGVPTLRSQIHGEYVPGLNPQDVVRASDGRRWRILAIEGTAGAAAYPVQEVRE